MNQMSSTRLTPILFLICLSLITRTSNADDYISPESIQGSTRINAETLIELARELDDLLIIDSRIKSDRHQGYISGSVSLPDTETSCSSLFKLSHNKDNAIVFYCNGPKCRRSDRAVVIARECGYRNIYWFRGGFEEWMDKQYLISK